MHDAPIRCLTASLCFDRKYLRIISKRVDNFEKIQGVSG
jgi:hypothetical protein